jgi:hypothetical protein
VGAGPRLSLYVIPLALAGCVDGLQASPGGAPSSGSPAPSAAEYTLVAARPGELPPDDVLDQPFDLPAPGTVSFSIANRSTDEPDHWDIGIFSEAEFQRFQNGRPATGYAFVQDVSARQASADVPEGGRYHLGIRCRNPYQACLFTFAVNARY